MFSWLGHLADRIERARRDRAARLARDAERMPARKGALRNCDPASFADPGIDALGRPAEPPGVGKIQRSPAPDAPKLALAEGSAVMAMRIMRKDFGRDLLRHAPSEAPRCFPRASQSNYWEAVCVRSLGEPLKSMVGAQGLEPWTG